MTKIPETQLDSWDKLQDNLSCRQEAVFKAVARKPSTLFELTDWMGKPVNHISGRITELKRMGRVRDSGLRRENPRTGKRGIVWEAIAAEQAVPLLEEPGEKRVKAWGWRTQEGRFMAYSIQPKLDDAKPCFIVFPAGTKI